MTAALHPARLREGLAASPWSRHLAALGLAWAAILLILHRDAGEIVAIWWNSSTFNHCLLIPPIIAWLVWQRLPELRRLAPAAWAPGLALVAAGALGWLLGEASGIDLARHAGLVLMLQGAAIACLGPAVSRGLAFPIFFALFLIPAGEELVPALQTLTARLAMAMLGLAGVPAHLEGIFITTASGYFEVAEACAGAKFLIAMTAFGALVANVCFRSWPRRIAFMAVSIVVPILANGVRAWGTIHIAHLTSVEFAAGFDHVVYGGIFFAIVIALILGLAWPFFDRGANEPWFDPAELPPGKGSRLGPVAAAAVALAALPLAWSAAISASATRPVPQSFELPQPAGWARLPPASDWRPGFAGADRLVMARYRDAQGRTVDLAVAVYARQSEGRELVGFGQGAAPPGGRWAWTGDVPAPPGGRAERIASHGVVREVVSFYRVGDILTGSGMGVKVETMKTRLLGGPQRAVAVLVSARAPATGVSPRPAIDAFLADLGPVDRLADRAAGLD
ncbi:exosortase A [Sphingosinicella sp. CPCC 101087]|uniref:exosortase A n=1 Tax=Sphingosinicella sp. CPCC 101087 TaxID=2497754 RepID=UPI00101D3FDC|nr:exosortase A [Sphingosinicella sp. CPCC 101087]